MGRFRAARWHVASSSLDRIQLGVHAEVVRVSLVEQFSSLEALLGLSRRSASTAMPTTTTLRWTSVSMRRDVISLNISVFGAAPSHGAGGTACDVGATTGTAG